MRLAIHDPKLPDEFVVIKNKRIRRGNTMLWVAKMCLNADRMSAPAARVLHATTFGCTSSQGETLRWRNLLVLCHPIVVSQAERRESELLTFVPRTGWVGEGAGREECGEQGGKQQHGKDQHRQWGRWGDEKSNLHPFYIQNHSEISGEQLNQLCFHEES